MADLDERYLGEAGYERVAWRPPVGPGQQPVWDKRLKGLLAAVASCLAIGLVVTVNNNLGPPEATAHMERLLAQLDRMNAVRPETAQAIMRIVSQPRYDCERTACDAKLKARNIVVRFRLATSLAAKAPSEVASSIKPAGEHRPAAGPNR